jgi:uncharacterized protein YbcI
MGGVAVLGAGTYGRSDGRLSLAIANMTVRVLRAHTGRGPTKSRTLIDDELITVILHDTLTTGERTLVANGDVAIVRSARTALADAMRDELIAGVEELTGRTVIALFSDSAIDPDIALESFVLAPQGTVTGALADENAGLLA